MDKVTVKRVESRQEMNDFLRLPHRIYAGCQQYVPDLDRDVRATFDRKKNVFLEHADIQPFVAYDGYGQCVGRIAGIINRRANETWHTKNVRFGFIEFIDDLQVSSALLRAVELWGLGHGMTHIQGPMGIIDFDKEGMLVTDFHLTSSMATLYNPPYYPQHLEQLGFQKEVDWVQIRFTIPSEIPAKYLRVAQLSKELFGLRVRKLTNQDIWLRGYGRKVFRLLNQAYAPLFGYAELTDRQIDQMVSQYFPLIDKRLVPIIEDQQGKLVGVAITMSSISRALQQTRGRLFPFGWYHLLKALKWKRSEKVELLLIAVHPDLQGLGVNALFFTDLITIYQQFGFRWAETAPQLEENVRELSQWKPLHPSFVKRRRCYTKQINLKDIDRQDAK